MRCSRCGRVLDEFRLTDDGWNGRPLKRRPYGFVKASAPPGGPTAPDTEFLLLYRCHRRCGREFAATAGELAAACSGAGAQASFTI